MLQIGGWSTRELEPGVGVIPTVLGEGLTHMPHGSDWSSIRDAGMNAAQQGACPDDAASRDGQGYAQEGNETVVMVTQRKRAETLEPKGTGYGVSMSPGDWHSPPRNPAEFPTLPPSPNREQERSNPVVALQSGSSGWSRCQPQGRQGGIESEAKAPL